MEKGTGLVDIEKMKDELPYGPRAYETLMNRNLSKESLANLTPEDVLREFCAWELGDGRWAHEFIGIYKVAQAAVPVEPEPDASRNVDMKETFELIVEKCKKTLHPAVAESIGGFGVQVNEFINSEFEFLAADVRWSVILDGMDGEWSLEYVDPYNSWCLIVPEPLGDVKYYDRGDFVDAVVGAIAREWSKSN